MHQQDTPTFPPHAHTHTPVRTHSHTPCWNEQTTLEEIKLHRAKNRNIALVFTLLMLRKRRWSVQTRNERVELDRDGYEGETDEDRSLIHSFQLQHRRETTIMTARQCYLGGWGPHASAARSPGRNQTSVRSGLQPQSDLELQLLLHCGVSPLSQTTRSSTAGGNRLKKTEKDICMSVSFCDNIHNIYCFFHALVNFEIHFQTSGKKTSQIHI